MKIVTLIARLLLGLIFVVFGLNGLLNFIKGPMPSGWQASLSARWSFLTISGLWLRSKLQVARYC